MSGRSTPSRLSIAAAACLVAVGCGAGAPSFHGPPSAGSEAAPRVNTKPDEAAPQRAAELLVDVDGSLHGETLLKATGVASGTDEAATHHATRQALRRAVEKAIDGAYHDHPVVRERIIRLAGRFVRRYRVASEEVREGSVAVTVEAVVDAAGVERELAAVRRGFETQRLPRLLVVFGPLERGAGGGNEVPTDVARIVNNTVEAAFARRGFRTVDLDSTGRAGVARLVYDAFEKRHDDVLAETARSHGAEVVVAGRVVWTAPSTRPGRVVWKTSPARPGRACGPAGISLRVLDTKSGRLLYSGSRGGFAAGEAGSDPTQGQIAGSAKEEPLVGAAKDLAAECVDAVVGSWRREPHGPANITVRVRGISFVEFARLRRAAERVRGVQLVSAAPFSSGTGELNVVYAGDALDLARSFELLPEVVLRLVSAGAETIEFEVLGE